MKKQRKWLHQLQQKIEGKENREGCFELSFEYAMNLFHKGDYLGAMSYFETAEECDVQKYAHIMTTWKQKTARCYELFQNARKFENQAISFENEGIDNQSKEVRKSYQKALSNYLKLKNLNPSHPGIRRKIWQFRFKSR